MLNLPHRAASPWFWWCLAALSTYRWVWIWIEIEKGLRISMIHAMLCNANRIIYQGLGLCFDDSKVVRQAVYISFYIFWCFKGCAGLCGGCAGGCAGTILDRTIFRYNIVLLLLPLLIYFPWNKTYKCFNMICWPYIQAPGRTEAESATIVHSIEIWFSNIAQQLFPVRSWLVRLVWYMSYCA